MTRIATGKKAEDMAAEYLQAKGMIVIERNFRAKTGEIDLIARDADEIVFVEVRARASSGYGGAAASVDASKRRKVVRAASVWLAARGWDGPCRFDVVAVQGGRLEHIPGAFEADSR
ncbi:MAG: YraN family protein [Elusimicrobia bacterium GWC2_65_9]|nr:MAG: YraN family protein [Elusimicrobia bacterium GWA2_66_18]OGR75996.1 MAG: YraN family protein [Elusimicrobia bacterium GWC2_65_9]